MMGEWEQLKWLDVSHGMDMENLLSSIWWKDKSDLFWIVYFDHLGIGSDNTFISGAWLIIVICYIAPMSVKLRIINI